jgi:hypothetical protein
VTVDQRPGTYRHAARMPLASSDALRGANEGCATCSVVKKAVPISRRSNVGTWWSKWSYATMWQVTVDQRPGAYRHAARMPLAPSDALRGANEACPTCSVVKKAVSILRQLRQALGGQNGHMRPCDG